MKRMEGNFQDQIASLDKRMDTCITGLAQHQQETHNTRELSRDGRPYYVCGLPGHYQNSCPRRNNLERERPSVPRYVLPAPDNYTQYSSGPQARQWALPPPPHQSRIAAFQDSTPTPSSHLELPIYSTLPNMTPLTGLIIMMMSYWKPQRPITKTLTMMTLMETGINITIMNQKPRRAIM